jgi:2-oxoisovalerate dehydrogenase E1 component
MQSNQPDWIQVARTLLLSRKMDQLEIDELTPAGKVKYQFSAGGHELIQILLAHTLYHPHDAATVYYRSRPFMLACGLTPAEALAAGMAREMSPSQGRDVGVVYNMPRRNGLTVLPSSGAVGAQYTPAAGWAQAIRYRVNVLNEPEWEGAIAVALGGDGSEAANGFWAALNIVTSQKLPLLFFIEDNGYGISVPSRYQYPEGNIASNLASYNNLKVMEGNGSHPVEAWNVIREAVDFIRSYSKPCLVRMRVPRLLGHTYFDNQAYKSAELLTEEASRDPIIHLKTHLIYNEFISEKE